MKIKQIIGLLPWGKLDQETFAGQFSDLPEPLTLLTEIVNRCPTNLAETLSFDDNNYIEIPNIHLSCLISNWPINMV